MNAGNTTSTKLIPSAFAGICFIHPGIFDIPASALTKTITQMVIPRKASIEMILFGESVLYMYGTGFYGVANSIAIGMPANYNQPLIFNFIQ